MFEDRFTTATDGTLLHWREYRGQGIPVVCLHGLTRNARDFEGVATALAEEGCRMIVPDVRGRGASGRADPATYTLPVYLTDLDAVFAAAGLTQAVFVGTSMGGLLTMLTAAARPGRVLAACINDIGPVVERAGLERIASYIGRSGPSADWAAAAAAIEAFDGAFFPDYKAADWAKHARRRCREDGDAIVFDYDPLIAGGFSADPGDGARVLWPMFDALAKVQTLVVRGELSDILSEETAVAMRARSPNVRVETISRVGHAPTIEEGGPIWLLAALYLLSGWRQ